MNDQKIDNLLNLSLDATMEEREKSLSLNVGYDEETRLWDIIVKYSGPAEKLQMEGITVVPLLGDYAVVTLPQAQIRAFSQLPQVEFIEKPKRLFFAVFDSITASCIRFVQVPGNVGLPGEGLSGRGVLVGIVDSGFDYRHPDFCNPDNTTRILRLWDQTAQRQDPDGTGGGIRQSRDPEAPVREEPGFTDLPPQGYLLGVEYTRERINAALALPPGEGYQIVPQRDTSGHGTAVLGILAGNGRSSEGVFRGVAYESEILAVKLGIPGENSFPRTAELMQAVDYLVRTAREMGKPIAINLSFGNNYGSHRGDSLLETYLNTASNFGRNVICTGTGNNGADNLHASGSISDGEVQEIEFSISPYEPSLNIQLWKAYADQISITLEHPSGIRIGPLAEQIGTQKAIAGNTQLLIYYGKPGPYQITQEIYFEFLPLRTYLDSGVWKIILRGIATGQGRYDLWMPGGQVLNPFTGFFLPDPSGTLTIPATASEVISVAAYDAATDSYVDFSGRAGRTFPPGKPDLAAPGVDVITTAPQGSYTAVTGTSFAAPFVTGSSALLMEWGILRQKDPFLYGQKVKAYLQRGARPLRGFSEYPNTAVGYGGLCLRDSLPD